jgi:hypothetical protein
MSGGTWEVHRFLQGKQYEEHKRLSREALKKDLWMTESVVVAMKRVMIVEQRAGG